MSLDLITHLLNQKGEALAKARAIADKAAEEARPTTEDERIEADAHMERVKSLTLQIEGMKGDEDLRKKLASFEMVPDTKVDGPGGDTIGEYFVKSDLFAKCKGREKFQSESMHIPEEVWRNTRRRKSLPILEGDHTTNIVGTGGAYRTVGDLATPGYMQTPNVLADLFTVIPVTSGNSIIYPIRASGDTISGSGSGSELDTGEGADKVAREYTFNVETLTLGKIAAFTTYSAELNEDAPAVVAWINADLPYQVSKAEDLKIAAALYDSVGTATNGGDNDADAILGAITDVRIAGFEPDFVLIHPNDWAVILTEKIGSGFGYVFGNPRDWMPRVVVSQSAQDGHPLVGASRGANVWRKGGLSVDMSDTTNDNFRKNLVSVRAELRMVAAKVYPEAFVQAK